MHMKSIFYKVSTKITIMVAIFFATVIAINIAKGHDNLKEIKPVLDTFDSVWVVTKDGVTNTETWTQITTPDEFNKFIKPVPIIPVEIEKVKIEPPVLKPKKKLDRVNRSINKTIELYLSRLDELGGSAQIASDEIMCMAENIYYEARSEPLEGQVAVALVTMNRVTSIDYPATVCGVVKQGPIVESWKTRGKDIPDHERKYYPRRHKCQFSWWCDGKAEGRKSPKYWNTALAISLAVVMDKAITDLTNGATHYHATYVNPKWAKKALTRHQIGEHIFYRLKE
jgi:N-acetylmuramoyl-L-alanine amidase